MITESDNSATDFLLEVAGGPEAVTKMLRGIGITDQRVDRYVSELLTDSMVLEERSYQSAALAAYAKDPTLLSRQSDRNLKFEQKDHVTKPHQMPCWNCFLAIDSGKALSKKSREFLLGVMSRTRTGAGRLKGLLPKGTPVATKQVLLAVWLMTWVT